MYICVLKNPTEEKFDFTNLFLRTSEVWLFHTFIFVGLFLLRTVTFWKGWLLADMIPSRHGFLNELQAWHSKNETLIRRLSLMLRSLTISLVWWRQFTFPHNQHECWTSPLWTRLPMMSHRLQRPFGVGNELIYKLHIIHLSLQQPDHTVVSYFYLVNSNFFGDS